MSPSIPKLGLKALTGPRLTAGRRCFGFRGGGMKAASLCWGREAHSVLVSAVMLRLEHPCIARLVSHAESFQEVVIVMEFYPGGELGRLVEEERKAGRLSEQTAMFHFYQVTREHVTCTSHSLVL